MTTIKLSDGEARKLALMMQNRMRPVGDDEVTWLAAMIKRLDPPIDV